MEASVIPAGGAPRDVPLAVDLDGTLIRTDSLAESLVLLLKRQPLAILQIPAWVVRGKAALKREVADRVQLNAALLPCNEEFLAFLREQQSRRDVILCSAADERTARQVAAHLVLFSDVMATRDDTNLKGATKARALADRYGHAGFDYAGNDVPDLAVFAESRRALVVRPTAALRRRLPQVTNLERVFDAESRFSVAPYLRAMRPYQWVKNLLVYVAVLATLDLSHLAPLWSATLAFLAFSLVASAVYLFNDLIDLDADRRHPRKRLRPFAAGDIPVQHGFVLVPLLLLGGILLGAAVSWLFEVTLLTYAVASGLYALWLKRVPLLETLVLAGLYTLRVLAGAAAIAVVPSSWLVAFSMFFFLSIALAKRHSELVELEGTSQSGTIPGRQYRPEDLPTLMSEGTAAGYAAVLVLALYINSDEVRRHYLHPEIIWLICPLLLYWINKLWLNSQRREINDDPVIWALTNRVSRAIAVLSVGLLMLAKFLPPWP